VGTSPYTTCKVQVQANGAIKPGKSNSGKREFAPFAGFLKTEDGSALPECILLSSLPLRKPRYSSYAVLFTVALIICGVFQPRAMVS